MATTTKMTTVYKYNKILLKREKVVGYFRPIDCHEFEFARMQSGILVSTTKTDAKLPSGYQWEEAIDPKYKIIRFDPEVGLPRSTKRNIGYVTMIDDKSFYVHDGKMYEMSPNSITSSCEYQQPTTVSDETVTRTTCRLDKRLFTFTAFEDRYRFVLMNSFVFELEESDFESFENFVEFKILKESAIHDEIIGILTDRETFASKKAFTGLKVIKPMYVKPRQVTTVFTDHHDYQPAKRMNIMLEKSVHDELMREGSFPTESVGMMHVYNNMYFVPKIAIKCRFNKQVKNSNEINPELWMLFLSSVAKQRMNCQQLAETAQILATLQMCYLKTENTFDAKVALFAHLFDQAVTKVASTHNMEAFSRTDVWNELFKIERIYIPYEYNGKFKGKNFSIKKCPLVTSINFPRQLTYDFIEKLVNTTFEHKKQEEMSKHELIENFHSGVLFTFSEKVTHFNISYESISKNLCCDDNTEKTPEEKCIMKLVEDRFKETNVFESMCRTVDYLSRYGDEELLRRFIKKTSVLQFDTLYFRGLYKLCSSPYQSIPDAIPSTSHEKVQYINQYLSIEKKICRYAQAEAKVFAKILGFKIRNIFNTVDYTINFALLRRLKIEPIVKSIFDDNQSAKPKTSMLSSVKGLFNSGKNAVTNILNASQKIADFNMADSVKQATEMVTKHMKDLGLEQSSASILNFDSSTISTILSSVKGVINGYFNDTIKKVCSLLGIDVETKFEADRLLFYYLVWINSESKILKWYIIIDICATLGILDLFWRIVKGVYAGFKSLFDKPDPVSYESAMSELEARVEKTGDDTQFEVKKKVAQVEVLLNQDDEMENQESMIDYLLDKMSNATPVLLGMAGVACVTALGFTANSNSANAGARIVNTMRSLAFVSMGLAAMPKIYSNILAVFHYVVDEVKSAVLPDHITKIQKMERIQTWLKNTLIVQELTPKILVRNLKYVFHMLRQQIEMIEIMKFADEIDDINLRTAFVQRVKEMNSISGLLESSAVILLRQREMYHAQLWSSTPGVGKSDLATRVMKAIQVGIMRAETKLGPSYLSCSGKVTAYKGTLRAGTEKWNEEDWVKYRKENCFQEPYPTNDTLKHADLYFGQNYGYLDEDNVTSQVEPDTLVQKLMLNSAHPVISQQANLTDKGRVFVYKAFVSNTNNAYIAPQGLLNPEALFRRRSLFKVEVKHEFTTDGKLDATKIRNANINRTNGEHLLITKMDSIVEKEHLDFKNMSVEEFLKLVALEAEEKTIIEERRLLALTGTTSILRWKMEYLKEQLYDRASEDFKNFGSYTKLFDIVNEEVKLIYGSNASKRFEEVIAHHRDEEDDVATEEPPAEKPVSVNEAVAYIKQTKFENKNVWMLCTPEDPEAVRVNPVSGKVDFSLFAITDDETRVCYTHQNPTKEQMQAFTYFMIMAETTVNETPKEYLREKAKWADLQTKKEKWWKPYQEKTKKLAQTIWSYTKYVGELVLEAIGMGTFIGLVTVVVIMVSFFTLSMIGQMLAPKTVSYNARNDRAMIIRTPNVSPVSSVLIHDVHNLATKATYKAFIHTVNTTSEATIIGIEGNIFLMNMHSVKYIEKSAQIEIFDYHTGLGKRSESTNFYSIEKKDIYPMPNNDACLVYIKGFRSVKNVKDHFVTEKDCEEDFRNFRQAWLSAVLLRPSSIKQGRAEEFAFYGSGSSDCHIVEYNLLKPDYPHQSVFTFTPQMSIIKGDSGSLIIHDENRIQNKFLGIMLSKDPYGKGAYCGVITREMLEKTLAKIPKAQKIVTVSSNAERLSEEHRLYDVFDYKEELYASPYPSQDISKNSGFRKSPIHGTFEVESEPAIQDVRDSRQPEGARHHMKVSLNKSSGKNMPSFSAEEEKFMKNILYNTYVKYVPGLSKVMIYNVKQAVTGIKMQGSTSINTKTCAGLPYKLWPGVKGKEPLLKYDSHYNSWNISEVVFQEVDYYLDHYNNAQVPYNLKLEFRKKELVGKNKIVEPKTRTVATGNMIHQIVYNMLFKDLHTFVKNVWDRDGTVPFALGVDPERHWNKIAKHLKFLDYIVEYDVKAWESRVSLRSLTMAAEVKTQIIKNAYASRGEKLPLDLDLISQALVVDYTDAHVVYADIMYRKRQGLLSGHPGTFVENSEIHLMYIYLILQRALSKKKPEWANQAFIMEHFRVILAADDVLLAISPLARNYVGAQEIRDGYDDLGIEITAPDKTDRIQAVTLKEAQFLKQKFVEKENEFYPSPNLSIIYQLFNWVRDDTSLPFYQQFQVNLENAFRFAFWRGEEEYELIRKKANEALLRHNMCWSHGYQEMKIFVKSYVERNEQLALQNTSIPEVEEHECHLMA